MTLTVPRLLTVMALSAVVMAFTFLARCSGERADEPPAAEQTNAAPPPDPVVLKPTRPDPTAAVIGGVSAGMASDAGAAVAAAAEASAADTANR